MHKLLPIVLTFFIFIGCQKFDHTESEENDNNVLIIENHSNEVAEISNYLLAKPGSWWEYSDGHQKTCGSYEATAIYTFHSDAGTHIILEEDIIYTPVHPFFGKISSRYQVVNSANKHETLFKPIFDTVIGVFYENQETIEGGYSKNGGYFKETRKVVEIFNSFPLKNQVFHNVIHVNYHHERYYGFLSTTHHRYNDYYIAEGVGVIKHHYKFLSEEYEASLIDYHIEN